MYLYPMKPTIGISIGDLNGVGPELLCKIFSDSRLLEIFTPIIYGNTKVLNFYKKGIAESVQLQFNAFNEWDKLNPKQINVWQCWEEDVALQPGVETPQGGQYAIKALMQCAQHLKEGKINGMVTMPINKNNTQSNDFKYTGHTPFLKDYFQAKEVIMLMVADELRVALLTEHVAVADITKHITGAAIKSKIEQLVRSMRADFGVDKPKIAVLALNPHASDGGLIGKEEQEIIRPALDELVQKGIQVHGPYAADGFFARRSDRSFDVVLAMYHDQGLIPFKALDLERGVNYTAGMNVVRTSPDHGTAYDIVGKNIADTQSTLEAIFTCIDIVNARAGHRERTDNPLQRGMGAQQLKKNKSKEDVVE
jgi:4-hydroxythreonine-4-phosphate dehydrogenase